MIRRTIKGLKVLREPGFRHALRHGVAASIEHDGIPLPREIAHVIDVGANRGQFLTWASVRFPHARFDCFEPLDDPRSRLQTVLPRGRSVAIHPVALGETSEELDFHVALADDSSSLLKPSATQTTTFPEAKMVRTIEIPVRRLDDELQAGRIARPSLLKIDVQGGELGVLKGGRAVLGAIDYVIVECSFVELYVGQPLFHEIIEFLAERDFYLNGYFSPSVAADGRLLQADGLFSRNTGGITN
ncbi:MAG: FkbM family methyltransferase [Solirubrobacterales bacterium]